MRLPLKGVGVGLGASAGPFTGGRLGGTGAVPGTVPAGAAPVVELSVVVAPVGGVPPVTAPVVGSCVMPVKPGLGVALSAPMPLARALFLVVVGTVPVP